MSTCLLKSTRTFRTHLQKNRISGTIFDLMSLCVVFFFFSSRRRHTRSDRDWSSDVCSSDLPGIMIGHRLISPGDEHALLPEEAPAFASSVVKVRRASGAARIVARQLLARLGYRQCPLPKAPSGAPIWPAGVVGSLTHDSRVAVAAVATSRDVGALGIDVEPA